MAQTIWPVDLNVQGALSCSTFYPPAGCINDAAVAANAAIDADKLQHRHCKTLSQAHGSACADETRIIHTVYGATAAVVRVSATLTVACVGDSTITVQIYKNSVSSGSILAAVISFSSADAAFAEKVATITSPNLVVGDNLVCVIDATVGTGTLGQGVSVDVRVDEAAA